MPAQRIVLLTGNPLSTNPRVIKEAAALTKEGYEVRVLGAWSTEQGVEADKNLAAQCECAFVPLLPPDTSGGKLHRLVQSAARKSAPWSRWSFGLMPCALARAARRFEPQLAIAHSEAALFAALALHRRGCKVGVDMEDWFSEDLPPEARRGRPVALLRRAERGLLRCASHATCTTEAMADALVRAYGCPRPERIYNVFPSPVLPQQLELRDRSSASKSLNGTSSRGRAVRSIHWFSQTIGPGRGLEDLFGAAESLPDEWEIHLRGTAGRYEEWLASVIPAPVRHKVFVHAPVPAAELAERIAEHDIGFAGETASIRSRDLTATNKMFQYLQSGLAVLASETAGQREVAALAGSAVHLFRADDTEDLATKLGELTHNTALLREGRERARFAAQELCWEKEQQRFLKLVHRALPASAA
jgi:hypothetical protein